MTNATYGPRYHSAGYRDGASVKVPRIQRRCSEIEALVRSKLTNHRSINTLSSQLIHFQQQVSKWNSFTGTCVVCLARSFYAYPTGMCDPFHFTASMHPIWTMVA
ncbi:Mitochondrial division protein [Trichinella spiralis]|uniref:Mitochondrial division protein n=1 Tax=Trichinella spiralis TaxID=6334 RepID=A0ABR3KWG6_TRISP